MKNTKLALVALFVGLFGFANAQSFTISPSNTVSGSVGTNGYLDLQIDMDNNLSGDLSLDWVLVSNSLNPNWAVTMCDYQACYPFIPNSRTMDPVPQGSYGFIKLTIAPNDEIGSGQVVFKVWETGNQANTEETITFDVDVVVAVDEADLGDQIAVAPNPAQDHVGITALSGNLEEGQISLYDLSGALVATQLVNYGQHAEMDISSLASGMYVLRYECANGVLTEKVFKSR